MEEFFRCQKCKDLDGFIDSVPPIFNFGNFDNQFWLLSINPSNREFPHHVFPLNYYGLNDRNQITNKISERIIRDQNDYFKHNYYAEWFSPIEIFLNKLSLSFGINSVARVSNIDIVKCATNKVWGKLDKKIKNKFIENCACHLLCQLKNVTKLNCIIINGSQVFETFKRLIKDYSSELTEIWIEDEKTKKRYKFYNGSFKIDDRPIDFIGSSANIPGSYISIDFKKKLIKKYLEELKQKKYF